MRLTVALSKNICDKPRVEIPLYFPRVKWKTIFHNEKERELFSCLFFQMNYSHIIFDEQVMVLLDMHYLWQFMPDWRYAFETSFLDILIILFHMYVLCPLY